MRRFKEGLCDLVVTGIFMPEKDSLEFIMKLRWNFPNVKNIAISSESRISPENSFSEDEMLSAHHIIRKSFKLGNFLETIRSLVDYSNKQDL